MTEEGDEIEDYEEGKCPKCGEISHTTGEIEGDSMEMQMGMECDSIKCGAKWWETYMFTGACW